MFHTKMVYIMELEKSDMKRYAVLIVGLVMAGGFTFGGMLSMASMVQSPSGSGGDSSVQDAELPSSQYSADGFNLTDNQKLYLASTNSKVFVTGYYSNSSQKEMLSGLRDLPDMFGDVVYVELSDDSSGRLLDQAGISNYPAIIINAGMTQRGNLRVTSKQNVTESDLTGVPESICSILSEYPNDKTTYQCTLSE